MAALNKLQMQVFGRKNIRNLFPFLKLYQRYDGSFNDETGIHTILANSNAGFEAGLFGGSNSCRFYYTGTPYVEVGNSSHLSLSDGTNDIPYTFSFAIRLNLLSGTNNWIFSKRLDSSTEREWDIYANEPNSTLNFLIRDSTNANRCSFNITLPNRSGLTIGQSHIIISYNGDKTNPIVDMYVDGVSQTVTKNEVGTYNGTFVGSGNVLVGNLNKVNVINSLNGSVDYTAFFPNLYINQAEATWLSNKVLNGIELI